MTTTSPLPLPSDARIYTTMPKDDWGKGPWANEPDKVQWLDPKTGLDCLMHRNHSGTWCGYVGVPEGHPLYAKPYGEAESSVDVHGGLTYADFCRDTSDESIGICHVPYPGMPERVWWLGFDCHHSWDFAPGMTARLRKIRREMKDTHPALFRRRDVRMPREHYWTMREVIAEVEKLAAQLRAIAA